MKKILLLTAAPFALLAGCSSGDETETAADDGMTTEVPAQPMGTATDGTAGTGTDTGTGTGTAPTGVTGTGTTGTGDTTGAGTGTATGNGTGTGTTPPTDTTDK